MLLSTGQKVAPGSEITIERFGGNVRFASGKIIERGDYGRPLPQKGKTYVFFLRWDKNGNDYIILTGYHFDGEIVVPLDGTTSRPFFKAYMLYEGVPIAQFRGQLNYFQKGFRFR